MSNIQIPEGMISVEDFAKKKGLAPEKVIKMVKDGFYAGRIIDEQWFVDPVELTDTKTSSKNSKGIPYRSEYGTARKVSMFISFLGWIVFAVGMIFALIGMASGLKPNFGTNVTILGFIPGLIIALPGLFLVAAGQVTRATVDNADHTREILKVLQNKG